jgi:hypothetical protein
MTSVVHRSFPRRTMNAGQNPGSGTSTVVSSTSGTATIPRRLDVGGLNLADFHRARICRGTATKRVSSVPIETKLRRCRLRVGTGTCVSRLTPFFLMSLLYSSSRQQAAGPHRVTIDD